MRPKSSRLTMLLTCYNTPIGPPLLLTYNSNQILNEWNDTTQVYIDIPTPKKMGIKLKIQRNLLFLKIESNIRQTSKRLLFPALWV